MRMPEKAQPVEIVDSSTKSVESGRDLKDITGKGARVWQSNRSARASVAQASVHSSRAPSSSRPVLSAQDFSSVTVAVGGAQPDWIVPQLATLVDRMPTDEGGRNQI